jgi:hypothetical protein
MMYCHACRCHGVKEFVDVGLQPICNRFVSDVHSGQYLHPMVIGQCQLCGLVQICNPVPAHEIRPRVDWITYNEPEPHLDDLVKRIIKLPGITTSSRIYGVSFKDDSTLARFAALGFVNTRSIDVNKDLGIVHDGTGVESIQDRLTPSVAAQIRQVHGPADIVIARHILEHAHDIHGFLGAMRELMSPTAYAVFEAPDCGPAIERYEYTTLWEEHTAYFTRETYCRTLLLAGLALADFYIHPYPFENSLIAITRQDGNTTTSFDSRTLAQEIDRFRKFATGLPRYGEKLRHYLTEYRQGCGKIALFGAGHLAATYINIFGLAPFIEYVLDDNSHKRGLYMPGSMLPIRGSSELASGKIQLCLLGLNPQSEEKVVANNGSFVKTGGTFASIFASSLRALCV